MKYIMVSHMLWNMKLSPNAFKLYCVCLTFANRATGSFVAKVETIALRGGLSDRSVARGLAELEAVGLLNRQHRFINREHYIASRYTIVRLPGRFTMIPLEAVYLPVNAYAFVLYSYLLKCMDKQRRAFPSFRGTAAYTGQSTTTIQKYIRSFSEMKLLQKERFVKTDGSLGHNQYQLGGLFSLLSFALLQKKKEQMMTSSTLSKDLLNNVIPIIAKRS